MNIVVIITAVLLTMLSGCSKDFTLPPGVLGYVSLATSSMNEASPAVAFDGTNFLVVYETMVTATDHDIWATLVTPGGIVLSAVDIDATANDDRLPKVAFDGRNYLVVFQRTTAAANHYIFGAFVSTAGAVLSGSPFPIDNSTNTNLLPAVAFNPNEVTYLVVYQKTTSPTNHDIIGTLLATDGSILAGPFGIDASANDDSVPDVATVPDGTSFLVVYERTVSSTNHDIYCARVDATSGGVLSGSPFAIDASANDDSGPVVATGGGSYLVAYQRTFSFESHGIVEVPVDIVGTVGTPTAVDGPSDDDMVPSVASDGTNYLIAYQRTAGSENHNIIGTRVNPAGSVLGNVVIDTTSFDDLLPALAFGKGSYLVAYEEVITSVNNDIFGAFVAR